MRISLSLDLVTERLRPKALWTPEKIDSLAWWDASDESTITESGGSVSNVSDKSGNGNDLTQDTGSDQPSTGVDTQNGLNVLTYENLHFLEVQSLATPVSGDLLIVGMWAINDDTYGQTSPMWCTTGDNHFRFVSGANNEFRGKLLQIGMGASIGVHDSIVEGPSVYATVADFTGEGELLVFMDGIANVNNPGAYTTKLATPQYIRLNTGPFEVETFDSIMGEMIMLEDVTAATRQKVEGYLAWKWNVESNLPAGHPYKNRAPVI